MLLEMDLQDIPKLEPTSLHLRHFSCKPQVTNTRAIFQVPFRGCGTTLATELNHIVYKNVVDNSQQVNGSRVAVRHAPELYYPFACRYRQKYIVTLKEGQKDNQGNKNSQEKGNGTREGNEMFLNPFHLSIQPWGNFRSGYRGAGGRDTLCVLLFSKGVFQ